MPRRRSFALILTSSLAVFLLGSAFPGRAADKPVIEPKAERVLRASMEYLQKTPEFTFHADVSEDHYLPSGQMIQFGRSIDMFVRRPNKIRSVVINNEGGQNNVYYDGTSFTLFNSVNNSYAVWASPPTIDEFNDKVKESLGFTPPLMVLLHEDLLQNTLKKVTSGFYVGLSPAAGVLCHHLAFTQENADWQAWIEEGKQLTIRKLVVTLKKVPNTPQFTAVFSNWDFRPGLVDFLFAFDPPEGAIKVDFLPAGKQ